MMIIKWLGHSTFLVTGRTKLVIDPYDPSIAKLPENLTADVVTVSHNHFDHNYISGVGGSPKVVNLAGEYDIAGFHIVGINSYHDNENGSKRGNNTIFVFETEGVRLCHLGDLGQILTPEQLDQIGKVDILIIPVGGYYTIGPQEAKTVIEQIKPSVVIPMHYKVPGFTPANLPIAQVDEFINVIGWPVQQRDELTTNPNEFAQQKIIQLSIVRVI